MMRKKKNNIFLIKLVQLVKKDFNILKKIILNYQDFLTKKSIRKNQENYLMKFKKNILKNVKMLGLELMILKKE